MQSNVEGDNLVSSYAVQNSAIFYEEARNWVNLCKPIYLK